METTTANTSMKVTENTRLIQDGITYEAVSPEDDTVVYWLIDSRDSLFGRNIVAQSEFRKPNIPVISLEVDVEALAECTFGTPLNVNAERRVEGFISGYKAAQSDKKYTEADMRKAMERSAENALRGDSYGHKEQTFSELLDQLQKEIKEIHIDSEGRTIKIVE